MPLIRKGVGIERIFEKNREMIDPFMEAVANKVRDTAVAMVSGTKNASRNVKQSIEVQKVSEGTYRIIAGADHAVYLEYGSGPKGAASPKVHPATVPNPVINYHQGEVVVADSPSGRFKNLPFTRKTEGVRAMPFMRPGLFEGLMYVDRYRMKHKK